MKLKSSTSKKLRYGGVSAMLTAAIIAVIIIVNVIFSALARRFLWYTDMTPELLFTLSDECLDIIENGDDAFEESVSPIEMVDKAREEARKNDPDFKDEDLMINLIFCNDPDALESNLTQKYVYNSALELQDKFPDHIKVETYNIVRNPSAVSRFKVNSMSVINTTSVIIEFGTEFRVKELRQFYVFNSATDSEPWAYNGEKAFTAAILAVTRAESPLACITTNHGETVGEDFINTLYDAGFKVEELDLAANDIPEDCRLVIIHDPLNDFLVDNDGISDINEITKLDNFIDKTNSLMVFMSPDLELKPGAEYALPNLEEYLEEWGVKFDRYSDPTESGRNYSYKIIDKSQSLSTNGLTFKGQYVTDNPASGITKELRDRYVAPAVIFPNTMSISFSDTYDIEHYDPTEDENASADDLPYTYATYGSNGTYRNCYELFVSTSSAEAWANGKQVATATASPFKLMTITQESRISSTGDTGTINEASYVIACGSVEFGSETTLQSNSYGNTDLLLSVFRTIGQEPVPVGLTYKPFADSTIDIITTKEATQYTVVLTVVPVVLAFGAGIFVLVRRKNR